MSSVNGAPTAAMTSGAKQGGTVEARYHQYQVVGRLKPSAQKGTRKSTIYKMNVFAPNSVIAKSRFWYYMSMLNRVKKANGEILQINEVTARSPVPCACATTARCACTDWARVHACCVRAGLPWLFSGLVAHAAARSALPACSTRVGLDARPSGQTDPSGGRSEQPARVVRVADVGGDLPGRRGAGEWLSGQEGGGRTAYREEGVPEFALRVRQGRMQARRCSAAALARNWRKQRRDFVFFICLNHGSPGGGTSTRWKGAGSCVGGGMVGWGGWWKGRGTGRCPGVGARSGRETNMLRPVQTVSAPWVLGGLRLAEKMAGGAGYRPVTVFGTWQRDGVCVGELFTT